MTQCGETEQLGFGDLLAEAEAKDQAKKFGRKTAHLPETMQEAIRYFRGLIQKNNAAVLAADEPETRRVHEEAHLLAVKLNGGDGGILAHNDAPGYVLARATAADPGFVPLWGQTGDFVVEVAGFAVRVEMEGMLGIGSGFGFWPGFAAHAIDLDRPFLSETGYRSFLGLHADPVPGLTPDKFAASIMESYVADQLRGRPVRIAERWKRQAA